MIGAPWMFAIALLACGDDPAPSGGRPDPSTSPTVDSGTPPTPDTETETGTTTDTGTEPVVEPDVCDAGDALFVERAIELMWRRRPRGSGEVLAWEAAVRDTSRPEVLAAMARSPEYVEAWSTVLLDLLRVERTGYKEFSACFETPRQSVHDGSLAAHVRANDPAVAYGEGFNGADLLRDALVADDVSVAYRAWLLARMNRPQRPCETLSVAENEAHARRDFGASFYRTYLNRPVDCLGCHNSEWSVTDHPDPALDHSWPLPAHLEKALFGDSAGPVMPDDAYAVFRHQAMVNGDGRIAPWGWDPSCGTFSTLDGVTDDLVGQTSSVFIDELGADASPYTLERYLAGGVDDLGAGGLAPWPDGTVAGPEAFAYLLAANVGDLVFADVAGQPLTVAHGISRTQGQAERLQVLADTVAARFSLLDLLQVVAADPVFNAGSPAACDGPAYGLPPLVEPWSTEEDDPVRRGNGAGDLVHRLSPRVLVRSVHDQMLWTQPPDFGPSAEVEALWIGVGAYRREAEPGFAASDLTSLLTLENSLQMCATPPGTTEPDYIARLVDVAVGQPAEDAVRTLKDRMLAHSELDPAERPLVEAVLGLDLGATVDDPVALEEGLRALCSTWLISAPFQLRVDRPQTAAPPLDPLGVDFCEDVEAWMTTGVTCP